MFACLYAPGNLAILLECASHFSPLIEETSPDTVIFDIRGLGLLYGGAKQIADEIQSRVAMNANLALAANPDAAMHAAQGLPGLTILVAGQEAAALSRLPLRLLGGSAEFARTLDTWGIRTFGEFAALPPIGVAARLGEEGSHLQRLASGAGHRQLRLRTEPQVFREEQELEEPVDLLEPLLFVLSRMLTDICARLGFHGRSTNEINLRLALERAPDHSLRLQLPVPMRDPKVFLKLLQLELNERAPRAPVQKIFLELLPVEPRVAQHGLFQPVAPEPEKLEITLSRIRLMVGAENVGAPELLDTHRPDAFKMGPLHVAQGSGRAEAAIAEIEAPLLTRLAIRRFRPACRAQVWCNEGKPIRIQSLKGSGEIVACVGPYRSAGDWWSGEAWDEEQWDVEIQNQGVAQLRKDCLRGQWFLQGFYD